MDFSGQVPRSASGTCSGGSFAASYSYIRRIPGADVALWVTAYQMASSTQAAVASIRRGRSMTEEVQSRVREAIEETVEHVNRVLFLGTQIGPE